MRTYFKFWILLCFVTIFTQVTSAQNPQWAIVFRWNDTLHAQSISDNELVQASSAVLDMQTLPTTGYNIYTADNSPILPTEGYGFYQGLWSSDRTQFVYTEIASDSAVYRVMLYMNGQTQILIDSAVDTSRGYLVPIGWTTEADLILLERYTRYNLNGVRVWRYDEATSDTQLLNTIPVPAIKGNTASFADGWVFIGFDTIGVQGYLLNINTLHVIPFNTSFALQDPPASVFEIYPIAVHGIINLNDFKTWLDQQSTATDTPAVLDPTPSTQPFLHWPLPEYARSITCYPDSAHTAATYAVQCPGLATPRAYQGHEGTDVGGKPAGLAVGTPVYAASQGIVVTTYSDCVSDDISCGDSYGNYVLLEHSRVINHEVETWFTGYAHLQSVLVYPNTYIDAIGIPIALSGDTGLGGAHLHFEVRAPHILQSTNWIDPWANGGLWIGGTVTPLAAVIAAPPPTQLTCQSVDGNNIRRGPGISYEIVATTTTGTTYEVFQIQSVQLDAAPGDWYHIRWQGADESGWIWSGVMPDCTNIGNQ